MVLLGNYEMNTLNHLWDNSVFIRFIPTNILQRISHKIVTGKIFEFNATCFSKGKNNLRSSICFNQLWEVSSYCINQN